MSQPQRMIITGVSPYAQGHFVNEHGNKVWQGCGPTAALMLMSYYDKCLGYKKLIPKGDEGVTTPPDDLIQDLRNRMKTITVPGSLEGLTDPTTFKLGLKGYVKDCGYDVDMDSYGSSDIGVSEDEVFDKSVSLIQSHHVHVLLLDWNDNGGNSVFPTHYVVVVGYNTHLTKRLIVCNGFGDNTQSVDLGDKSVKPVRAIWMTISSSADGPKDGHEIGPACTYSWKTVSGQQRLVPTVLEPPGTSGSTTWAPADSTTMLAGSTCSINSWNS
jgi:hypothetical protein